MFYMLELSIYFNNDNISPGRHDLAVLYVLFSVLVSDA